VVDARDRASIGKKGSANPRKEGAGGETLGVGQENVAFEVEEALLPPERRKGKERNLAAEIKRGPSKT